MFCEWCCHYDRNEYRNQLGKGYALLMLESSKKQELSRLHKYSEAAQHSCTRPDYSLVELALQTMERDELEQLKCLFNTVFYLVVAEHPFCDFPALLQLQALNGVPVERFYNNPTQA